MATGYNAFKKIGKTKERFEADPSKEERFIDFMIAAFDNEQKYNKTSIEKTAATFGITDAREVKELVEFALVKMSRKIAHNSEYTVPNKYTQLVYNYLKQVNLSLRTSTSILLQQYSTPIPIAYLMGIYCRIDQRTLDGKTKFFFEPSAGNGILTVAGTPQDFVVNEIDELRRSNLEREPYYSVFDIDGSQDFTLSNHRSFFDNVEFDGVITNPPFAKLDKTEYVTFGGYEIQDLDHLMAIRALSLMANNGRAAIIVGGHTKWDERGVIQSGKNLKFLSYLYKNFFVDDVILVNGDLYSKMGTSFDIRIILINGRRPKPEGYAPKKQETKHTVVNSFEELYERFAEVSGRDDMVVEKQNQIDPKYKYKVETDTKGTLYFEELPSDVYWGNGSQDPEDKNKAFWYGYDNGTSLISFQTIDGQFIYKGEIKKTSEKSSHNDKIDEFNRLAEKLGSRARIAKVRGKIELQEMIGYQNGGKNEKVWKVKPEIFAKLIEKYPELHYLDDEPASQNQPSAAAAQAQRIRILKLKFQYQ